MRRTSIWLGVMAAAWLSASTAQAAPTEAELKASVERYFKDLFGRLELAAAQAPTEETFRAVMKPHIGKLDGLFGATLINADWEIRQVYSRSDFLAVGFSLKKVSQLDGFRKKMEEKPRPQLSEPAHGNLMQPRLISLRYPVVKDGKMTDMVSIMIRTESFLKAVGLDACKAFRITCLGKEAERKGTLTDDKKTVSLPLPSTEWVIEYE